MFKREISKRRVKSRFLVVILSFFDNWDGGEWGEGVYGFFFYYLYLGFLFLGLFVLGFVFLGMFRSNFNFEFFFSILI